MKMITDKKSKIRTQMVSISSHSSIPTSSTGDEGFFRLVKRKSTHKDSRTLSDWVSILCTMLLEARK
jgi:hypothetical protein